MILVTGAAGKTGLAVIRALAHRRATVHAFVHRPEQVSAVREAGASQVSIGDARDAAAVESAMHGASAMYHLAPNVSPDEETIGQVAIAAAQRVGVERFVFHSVLYPHTEAMPHHWRKLRVEEQLIESGLPFSVLRPTAYMQNLLVQRSSIVDHGLLPVPYDPSAAISLVDLDDVAQAAALVLTEPGHVGAIYDLVGTEPSSQTAVADVLGAALGREIRVVPVAEGAWCAANAALDPARRDALLAMFRFYDRHGLAGNPNVLRWLLGRAPTSLEAFAVRALAGR